MRFLNCALSDIGDRFEGKNIVFFGCGSWMSLVNHTCLMKYADQFVYVIDNGNKNSVKIGEKALSVYKPDVIKKEKGCVVILTSPIYMYDMYCQLVEMNLGDEIECYAFPLMTLDNDRLIDESELQIVKAQKDNDSIPKIIHSFWFSGEKKTDIYRKCVDSWYRELTDYQIVEWNLDNYDWHKYEFVERAVELGAWAYASDYARLDVLKEFGGIYLDMDVEVVKSFDDLLYNEALLSFSTPVSIDLAVMAARQDNELIRKLLRKYDNVELPETKDAFKRYFQPAFIRDELVDYGISMNGCLQTVNGIVVLPNEFFMPQDYVLFRPYEITGNTYAIHYDCFGWSDVGTNNREKKMQDNNMLISKVERYT